MSVWFSYPEEEVYRELTAKLQQFQGKTDEMSDLSHDQSAKLIRWSIYLLFLHKSLECGHITGKGNGLNVSHSQQKKCACCE